MPKVEKSPLQLKGKNLLSLKIEERNPLVKNQEEIYELLNKDNEVNLNFDLLNSSKNTNEFCIELYLTANKGRKKFIGYTIEVKIRYFFTISKEKKLKRDIIVNLKHFSSLSIAIADLRALLESCTSSFQYKPFILPAIDMQKLLKDKGEESSTTNQEKKR